MPKYEVYGKVEQMELREALKLIADTCQKADDCPECPFSFGVDRNRCSINNIGVGENIDLICEAVEEVKKQAEKPMTVEDAQVYVIKHLDARAKLEQLAEEAAELSQAALKLIRAKGLSNNVTLVDKKEALDNVKKEIIDVLMCVKACGFEFGDVSMVEAMENSLKWIRWAERLKAAKK